MWSYPVDIIFTFEGKDYTLNEFKERVKELKAENAKLRDTLKYARRFLKPEDVDTDYIDNVLGKDGGMG